LTIHDRRKPDVRFLVFSEVASRARLPTIVRSYVRRVTKASSRGRTRVLKYVSNPCVVNTRARASRRIARARRRTTVDGDEGSSRREARVDARETSREMSAHKLSEEALRRHAAHMRNERERAARTKNALKKELDDFVRSGPKVRSTTRAREGWGRGSGRGGDKMGRGRDARSRLEVANARDASRRDD